MKFSLWLREPRTFPRTLRFQTFQTGSAQHLACAISMQQSSICGVLLGFTKLRRRMQILFVVTHFPDKVLLTIISDGTVPLVMAACRFLTQNSEPKKMLKALPYHAAASYSLRTWRVVFAEVIDSSTSKYDGMFLPDFLKTGILSYSCMSVIKQTFCTNILKRFIDDWYVR